MKELINGYQDKRGLWRRARDAIVITGALFALTACERQSQITEGTVYQKEHIKKEWALAGKLPTVCEEIEKEVVAMPPTKEKSGVFCEAPLRFITGRDEKWKIYIAQCSTPELPPMDKVEKECKTNLFDVPQEIYPALKIGQHADFKKDHF